MLRRTLLALAAMFVPTAALADTSSAPPKRFFALDEAPGGAWDHALGFSQQAGYHDHVAYLQDLFERGKLVIGGPFLDNTGGLLILDCDTAAEAQQIGADDPAVKSGVLTATVRPWVALFRPS